MGRVLRDLLLSEVQKELQDRIPNDLLNMRIFIEIFEKVFIDFKHAYDGTNLRVLVVDSFYLFSHFNMRHFPSHIDYVNDRVAFDISSNYDVILVIGASLHTQHSSQSSIIVQMDLVNREKIRLSIQEKIKR